MMWLLADASTAIDPLKALLEQWPWLAVALAIAKWFAAILDRVGTRHIGFIDALDKRDQESLVHQATMSLAMTGIDAKLTTHSGKLSEIKEIAGKSRCEAAVLLKDRSASPAT